MNFSLEQLSDGDGVMSEISFDVAKASTVEKWTQIEDMIRRLEQKISEVCYFCKKYRYTGVECPLVAKGICASCTLTVNRTIYSQIVSVLYALWDNTHSLLWKIRELEEQG